MPEADVVRKALRLVAAERAMRIKAEHELRQARLEVVRLRRTVGTLQRQQQTKGDARG